MTGNTEHVEPPLNSRRVQLLVASILVFALLSILFVLLGATNRKPSVNGLGPIGSVTIDLNDAAPRELALLPGVGPVLAKRIVENRNRLGPFTSLEDIGRVHGVGDKTIQQIDRYVTVNEGSFDHPSR